LSGDPKFTKNVAKIDFNFGTSGPGDSVGGTNFSARWTRTRYFADGVYQFTVIVDDGVRLWVDGVLIIDQWHDTAPTQYSVARDLSTGNHHMRLEYYQNTGGAQVHLAVEKVSGAEAWQGKFFNNINLQAPVVATKSFASIDFPLSNKSPVFGITADYWSARFTGSFLFAGGKYQFLATVDDGVRVYLDDNLIIDQWHETSPTTYKVDVDVSEGTHNLKIEYFNASGTSELKVRWLQL
jgi:hypothetical protein